MAEIDLSQAEADALLAMEKHRVDETVWDFPQIGQRIAIPLVSPDRRESFFVDVSRASIKLSKATFQQRARQSVVLLRLDIHGAPHRNPDGIEIPCPHLHIYRAGYGDKWAIAAPRELLGDHDSPHEIFVSFMQRCHVTQPPIVQGGLL
jgi:hypothetical protein